MERIPNTGQFVIGPDNKIHRGNQILNNSEVLPRLSEVPEPYRQDYEGLCSMYGKDRVDGLRAAGKTVAVLYPFAGMGHAYQAWVLAEYYQAMGFRVVFADIFEIAQPDELVRLKMEQEVLRSIHQSKRGEWDTLVRRDPKYFVLDKIVSVFATMGHSLYAAGAEDGIRKTGRQNFVEKIGNAIGKNLDKSKHVVPFLFRLLVRLEQQFVSKEMQNSMVSFCDSLGVDLVAASHTWGVRPFIGTKYEDRAFSAIPDIGYSDPAIMFSFAAVGSRIAHGTPGGRPAKLLADFFHIPKNQIFDRVGTLAQTPDYLAKAKWESDDRWVMISASGNNDNHDYMMRALQDWYSCYKNKQSPYGLILFLGMHNGKEVLNELERLGLTGNPNIHVVQTANMIETAIWRWYCKQAVQIDIAKPGENPLDSGPLGVVNLAIKAGARNEVNNLAHAAIDWGSAIPSAWPPEDYKYWKSTNEFSAFTAPGFERSQQNLFVYLDYLFGENQEKKNYARDCATRGRYSVPHQAGKYYAALVISKMLGIDSLNMRMVAFQNVEERKEKLRMVLDLVGRNWKDAPSVVDWLQDALLELAGYQRGEMNVFLKAVAPKTMVITIHGGAATRWGESFQTDEGKQILDRYEINPSVSTKARCLVDLPVAFSEHYPDNDRQPVIAWNFEAVRDIVCAGASHMVIAGSEKNKDELLGVASQMGMDGSFGRLQKVRDRKLKVQGHGDALLQQLDDLKKAKEQGIEYLVAHFAGDATDSRSVQMSLLLQYVLKLNGKPVSGVLPTAPMAIPKYPVYRDTMGRSVFLGHEKLYGPNSVGNPLAKVVQLTFDGKEDLFETGGSNIGVWVFDLPQTIEVLDSVVGLYDEAHTFARLPGHGAKQMDEFALDDLVRMLGDVVQIMVSSKKEIASSVKALTDITGFLESVAAVKSRQRSRKSRQKILKPFLL